MLACARIGAVHSVIFTGFSASALAHRIDDAECKVLLAQDFNSRGGRIINLKKLVLEATKLSKCVEKVLLKICTSNNTQFIPIIQNIWKKAWFR